MREPKRRLRDFNKDFGLIGKSKTADDEEPAFYANRSPWLYLVAFEAMLRTFCKAGTYTVPDVQNGAKPSFMVEREPGEEHLAQRRAFVLDRFNRSRKLSDDVLIRQPARLDMNIRKKWWKLFIENKTEGRTFTSCVRDSGAYAEQQWDQDLSIVMYPSPSRSSRECK